MPRPTRPDETQHIRLLPQHALTDRQALEDVAKMVREALAARVQMVRDLSEGVEYEAQLARERLADAGPEADLTAIRIGEYFRRTTEFVLLQRLNRAIQSRLDGLPHKDRLGVEDEQEG